MMSYKNEKIEILDQRPLKRIHSLIILQFALLYLALFQRYFHQKENEWILLLHFFLYYLLLRFMIQSFYKLFYSFWAFYGLLMIYTVVQLIKQFLHFPTFSETGILALYLLVFCLGILAISRLNTPLYYPLVKWWEYDFRFTQVWKVDITVKGKEKCYQGRITDMRRGAICLVLFEDIALGEVIELKQKSSSIIPFQWPQGKIFSKRFNNVGRGISYGVKILTHQRQERRHIRQAQKSWNLAMKMKKKYKFSFQRTQV
jgi:hypothetical protein